MDDKQGQIDRILSMYDRLRNGKGITKNSEVTDFKVSEKTIQRDLGHIRDYLETKRLGEYLVYNRKNNEYCIEGVREQLLTNEEIFAILKILLESRAFPKMEMDQMIDKITSLARLESQTIMKKLMANEKQLYVELRHQKAVFAHLWQLAQAVHYKKIVRFQYCREFDEASSERIVKPVGVIFSEYYFYLVAYQTKYDFDFPTIYRLDRIQSLTVKEAHYQIPYSERFQEGEFRQRVQFMYTGELLRLKFRFTGPSPQAVLDRLPTAKMIAKAEDGIIFETEVYGQGIKMWLLSQAEYLEVLEPQSFREEMKHSLKKMLGLYE